MIGSVVADSEMVEDQYRAQPTRYVREAQLGIIDGTFEEAWAIYDLDGHADHENACKLSQEIISEKKIYLGFSSISFELWILWHFESNITAFSKSQCRTGKGLHNCGQNTHADDCGGAICIVGYLKTQGFVSKNQDVKAIEFSELKPKLPTALTNAYRIRQITNEKNPRTLIYQFNPYTTVDRLVFKMLHLPIDYQWRTFEEITIPDFKVEMYFDKTLLNITLQNISSNTQIIHPDYLLLLDVKGKAVPILERKVFEPREVQVFAIETANIHDNNSSYIAFKKDEYTFYITELPIMDRW